MLIELSIACMAVIITSFINIPDWLDRKPFNCVVCLAYWTSLAYQIYSGVTLVEVLLVPFATAYVAYMFKKLLHI
jgi:hypothetical protein